MNILFILLFTFSGILVPKSNNLNMPEDYRQAQIRSFQKSQEILNSENEINGDVKTKKSISISIECSL